MSCYDNMINFQVLSLVVWCTNQCWKRPGGYAICSPKGGLCDLFGSKIAKNENFMFKSPKSAENRGGGPMPSETHFQHCSGAQIQGGGRTGGVRGASSPPEWEETRCVGVLFLLDCHEMVVDSSNSGELIKIFFRKQPWQFLIVRCLMVLVWTCYATNSSRFTLPVNFGTKWHASVWKSSRFRISVSSWPK